MIILSYPVTYIVPFFRTFFRLCILSSMPIWWVYSIHVWTITYDIQQDIKELTEHYIDPIPAPLLYFFCAMAVVILSDTVLSETKRIVGTMYRGFKP